MVKGGIEVVVGAVTDPSFGKLVAFRLGGVLVELIILALRWAHPRSILRSRGGDADVGWIDRRPCEPCGLEARCVSLAPAAPRK